MMRTDRCIDPGSKPIASPRYCQSMFTLDFMRHAIGAADCCPWSATAGRGFGHLSESSPMRGRPLYTAEQRRRRDESRWTIVQGVLAPLKFAVFLISLSLVMHYLASGHGLAVAT